MKAASPVETTACEAIVERLVTLMRTVAVHGPDHPLTKKSASGAAAAVNAGRPPFTLQFVAGGLFLNRVVVPVDVERFDRLRLLSRALHGASIHEVAIDGPVRDEAVLAFGQMLARGASGTAKSNVKPIFQGISCRPIPGFSGGGSDEVNPTVFAANQIIRAIEEAASISGQIDDPWDWTTGLSVVRRIERALLASTSVALRATEVLPARWTVQRRAVSACLLATHVLERLGVERITRRATAHAVLALGLQGFTDRAGMELQDAAGLLSERFMAGLETISGIDPHRLRTTAITHFLATARTRDEAPMEVLGLIHLLYFLERRRTPAGVAFDLTIIDLLAYAVQYSGEVFEPSWVRALNWALGRFPIGSPVLSEEFGIGIVLDNTHRLGPGIGTGTGTHQLTHDPRLLSAGQRGGS